MIFLLILHLFNLIYLIDRVELKMEREKKEKEDINEMIGLENFKEEYVSVG